MTDLSSPRACVAATKSTESTYTDVGISSFDVGIPVGDPSGASDPVSGISSNRTTVVTEDENLSAVTKFAGKRRILLLQGPVGPFFAELHKALNLAGLSVRRVLFNSGDRLFSTGQNCVRFSGSLKEWESWLRFEIAQNNPDCIVLFGSNRPAHKVARQMAERHDIDVISLEEGYLRSGYVTAEIGGNNQHSPLTKWKPTHQLETETQDTFTALPIRSSFSTMSFWGSVYYLARDFFSGASDETLFHRRREHVLALTARWWDHMGRRVIAKVTEIPTQRALRKKRGYMLVPLQVSSDSQLQDASRGWDAEKLIDACLKAMLETGPAQDVVFKLHPLERRSSKIKRLIYRRAKALRVAPARLVMVHSGRIGDLAAHSGGMVVINSTSAFSALHHDVPVLVLGDAIFRHDAIVTVGQTDRDVTDFFKLRRTKSPAAIAQFVEAVKAQSLMPGDFYVSAGRKIAVRNLVEKLEQFPAQADFDQREG